MPTVGVLAFQGDVAEHFAVLATLKVPAREVRSIDDLWDVDRLIIPGGESTVIAKFLQLTGVGEEVRRRVRSGALAIYGTCAGAILLATEVKGKNPPQALGLLDITVDRNAYGTQIQSFEASVRVEGVVLPLRVSFIRAPRITRVGQGVGVLAEHEDDPVLVRQGRVIAGTFHPEVRREGRVHEIFLTL